MFNGAVCLVGHVVVVCGSFMDMCVHEGISHDVFVELGEEEGAVWIKGVASAGDDELEAVDPVTGRPGDTGDAVSVWWDKRMSADH